MSRKTTESYLAVFKFIEQKLFKFQPTVFMSDYEDGLRKAIRECWPNVTIRGCWFHFCRAIMRRSKKTGMTKLLMRNKTAKIIQRELMSLPLLPADNLQEGFDCIVEFSRKKKLFEQFSSLFVYIQSYWLNNQVCSPGILIRIYDVGVI